MDPDGITRLVEKMKLHTTGMEDLLRLEDSDIQVGKERRS